MEVERIAKLCAVQVRDAMNAKKAINSQTRQDPGKNFISYFNDGSKTWRCQQGVPTVASQRAKIIPNDEYALRLVVLQTISDQVRL